MSTTQTTAHQDKLSLIILKKTDFWPRNDAYFRHGDAFFTVRFPTRVCFQTYTLATLLDVWWDTPEIGDRQQMMIDDAMRLWTLLHFLYQYGNDWTSDDVMCSCKNDWGSFMTELRQFVNQFDVKVIGTLRGIDHHWDNIWII